MKLNGYPVESLADVFRRHHADLVQLAAFILGDWPAGEDVVQDVFVRMHMRQDRLVDAEGQLPYLRAAVINGCRSALRRRRLIRRHADMEPQAGSPPLSAEEALLLSEDRKRMLAALARLSRRRREVLVLRFYLGLSEQEIAAMLGVSPGTVKSTASRGLAALAQILEESS